MANNFVETDGVESDVYDMHVILHKRCAESYETYVQFRELRFHTSQKQFAFEREISFWNKAVDIGRNCTSTKHQ